MEDFNNLPKVEDLNAESGPTTSYAGQYEGVF